MQFANVVINIILNYVNRNCLISKLESFERLKATTTKKGKNMVFM